VKSGAWNALAFDDWAVSGISYGERIAAQFLLAVWDPNEEWKCGKFDVMTALRKWDDDHLGAFIVWAKDPWWP
jgi:hypothetical protein